jgi:hypothetical protein
MDEEYGQKLATCRHWIKHIESYASPWACFILELEAIMAKSRTNTNGAGKRAPIPSPKRDYVSQTLLPKRKLRDAMLIPQAILESFGARDAAPHQIAMAINSSPTSSAWRDLTGAAIAYGLTDGGYNSDRITLTDLGRQCVAPTEDGQDLFARSEASLRPQILRQFFEKYDKAKFPEDRIAKNVLQHNFNVAADRVDDALSIAKDNAAYVGIVHNTKTGPFIAIGNPEPTVSISFNNEGVSIRTEVDGDAQVNPQSLSSLAATPVASATQIGFKVFISHGKNMNIVEQVKDVLGLYDIEFEVAVEEETTAIPVPDKVLNAMRDCHAGVMVVTADENAKLGDGFTINNNVLIEIGAAFVLYNKRVVLLWDKRLVVPSNLQGLYRCDFEGNELSFAVGTRLAKAVKSFRSS